MLIATLIHWDRFNHGDAPPIGANTSSTLVAVHHLPARRLRSLVLRTAHDSASRARETIVDGVQRAAQAFAAGAFVAAIVFYLFPEQAIDIWPWDLTPLTSRVLGRSPRRSASAR